LPPWVETEGHINDTADVNNIVDDIFCLRRRDLDHAAVCIDRTAVFNQCVGDVSPGTATSTRSSPAEIERDGFAGSEGNFTHRGVDDARVGRLLGATKCGQTCISEPLCLRRSPIVIAPSVTFVRFHYFAKFILRVRSAISISPVVIDDTCDVDNGIRAGGRRRCGQ
jgi:hypothetical protein